jgi:hypothetical protein
MWTVGALLYGLAMPSVISFVHTKRLDWWVPGSSVIAVLACILTCPSPFVRVAGLGIPSARDEGS